MGKSKIMWPDIHNVSIDDIKLPNGVAVPFPNLIIKGGELEGDTSKYIVEHIKHINGFLSNLPANKQKISKRNVKFIKE